MKKKRKYNRDEHGRFMGKWEFEGKIYRRRP
jgi:hypothetical protein